MTTIEHQRLAVSQGDSGWRHWGPYLAERAWGTVREDYSATGEAWTYFPFEHSHLRAYRWNEDGLAGLCDAKQRVCLALALWNGHDPVLKERLFGLSGVQGNHGEDGKELYYFLDSTPSHSYMHMRYKYPQERFPYQELIEGNAARGKHEPELELLDVLGDAFRDGRYFDVDVVYAKAGPEDICCVITVHNRAPEAAVLHVLPHLWFRNTWSWESGRARPTLRRSGDGVEARESHLGTRHWYVEGPGRRFLFTDNDTNHERLNGVAQASFTKDGIGRAVIEGDGAAVAEDGPHTKVAAHVKVEVPAGGSVTVRWRWTDRALSAPFADLASIVEQRRADADDFYRAVAPEGLTEAERQVQRQAFAGLMWTKQFFHFDVNDWLDGDPAQPAPPPQRQQGRNREWRHLNNADVISMPDSWEYPWYAVWDLAFHCVPIAQIDPAWAKEQLILVMREWYMHPNGQIPAYEWAFGDVNPPVHAWAALQVYRIDQAITGTPDVAFLERVLHKLMLNFTWWVNRKDDQGNNLFQGGFLGLDNIGVFDRSRPLPTGGMLEQADGTAWMAAFSLDLLAISLEVACHRPAYEDVATKFFEHFVYIASAMSQAHGGLWSEADGFYYDVLHLPDDSKVPMRLRSFVGLIPLFAVTMIDEGTLQKLPEFRERLMWFVEHRAELVEGVLVDLPDPEDGRCLLAVTPPDRLARILERVMDPEQFLAEHGLRAMSREHLEHPFELMMGGQRYRVTYEPGESTTGLFGGNSNWRGPIWFPVNYLMVDSLREYHRFYGNSLTFKVPCSDDPITLEAMADEIGRRLITLFLPDEEGRRPAHGGDALYATYPHFRDLVLFYEYFHGDNGRGIGASHQTGWTALVASLLDPRVSREDG
ncbi:MAG: glucosidase [Myxococcota bacterium]